MHFSVEQLQWLWDNRPKENMAVHDYLFELITNLEEGYDIQYDRVVKL